MKQKQYISEGVHALVDLFGVSNSLLDDGTFLESIMREACELSGAEILSVTKHKFEPAGWTILVSLSESHASIHTYVDLNNEDGLGEIFLDFFTCGKKALPQIGATYIVNKLSPLSFNMEILQRGFRCGIVNLGELCEIMC